MTLSREELERRVEYLEAEVVRLVALNRKLQDAPKFAAKSKASKKAWTTNPRAK